jgi:TonB-dependent SusC/RagA subfamily outer membrane receptor
MLNYITKLKNQYQDLKNKINIENNGYKLIELDNELLVIENRLNYCIDLVINNYHYDYLLEYAKNYLPSELMNKALEEANKYNATITDDNEKRVFVHYLKNEDKELLANKLLENLSVGKESSEELLNKAIRYRDKYDLLANAIYPVLDSFKELLIRGSVKDADGFPLPGVTVQIKGTNQGTTTDADGEYYIMVKNVEKPILVFSFIGMETQEVKFQKGKHRIDVVLVESQQEMQEVVVNGIYTRNIESFTGSVATFKGDDLKLIGPQNVLRSLSALDPSIIITENNLQGSNPNAKLDITINGKMSIVDLEQEYETDPNQPLFILDGFETTLQTISDLNMDRVESISILKDAASTAIYGSKAANGVIVVETKKPQAGKLRVNYNGSLSVAWADLSDYNLMNSAQKLEFEKLSGVYKTTNGNGYVNLDQNGEVIGASMMAD